MFVVSAYTHTCVQDEDEVEDDAIREEQRGETNDETHDFESMFEDEGGGEEEGALTNRRSVTVPKQPLNSLAGILS